LTVEPTTVADDGFSVTISGSLTANVTQFRVDQNGRIVAIANVSGTQDIGLWRVFSFLRSLPSSSRRILLTADSMPTFPLAPTMTAPNPYPRWSALHP
jgi:hypothetical protein